MKDVMETHLSQRYTEKLDDQHHQELVSSAVGLRLETRNVVQREKEADGAKHAVRYLSEDHGEGERELSRESMNLSSMIARSGRTLPVCRPWQLIRDKRSSDSWHTSARPAPG